MRAGIMLIKKEMEGENKKQKSKQCFDHGI